TISSVRLANLLHGSVPQQGRNLTRKFLVVLQFMVCTGLLSAALIIRGQANYLINKDLGYNTENVYNINLDEIGLFDKYQEVKTALQSVPNIVDMTGSPLPRLNSIMFLKESDQHPAMTLFYGYAEKNFNDLLKIDVLEGESFSSLDEGELENAILINESAVEQLGLENPIGEKLNGKTIKGVLKDFHFWSTKSKISPAAIQYGKENIGNIQIICKAGDLEKVKAQIALALAPFNPKSTVELTPLKNYFADTLQKEERLVSIFDYLTAILILVSFLGLFALATFENQLREKELGIRKVLGAGALNLIMIMNSKFFYLIIIAIAISIPISYLLISSWLADFSYRIDSLFQFYAYAALMITIGSIVLLSVQSYWKTKINPVQVLRNDN
ncbi:MAG TPA: FtsX-like permease family protein, partial [Roseivirga sp.]